MEIRIRALSLLLAGVALTYADGPGTLVTDAKASWSNVSGNAVKAAEKMPEENYSFRPTDSVRSYGQVVGHLADANYAICSELLPEKKSSPDAEKNLTAKGDLVKALKESVAYCNTAFEKLTDAQLVERVKFFNMEKARISIIFINVAHTNEHYGNMVTYLRLKGIVPPSSEPRPKAAYLPHVELPIPGMMDMNVGMMDMNVGMMDMNVDESPLLVNVAAFHSLGVGPAWVAADGGFPFEVLRQRRR